MIHNIKAFFRGKYVTQRGGMKVCLWGMVLLFCVVVGLMWPVRALINPPLAMLAIALWILVALGLLYVLRAPQKNHGSTDWKTLAQRDALTHVANRRGLMNAMAQLNSQKNCVLLMIDVDDFKMINDQYGHNVGDTVLCHLAACLQQTARQNDIVARWGGDEFVVVLVDAEPHVAALFGQRLHQLLKNMDSENNSDSPPTFSWTMGVATLPPRCELSSVIATADQDLLVNKKNRLPKQKD